MGTRADFYVGTGVDAEWLGSVAWDGYPDGAPEDVVKAESEEDYRNRVEKLMTEDDSATRPAHGWRRCWKDSRTTDYAYTFSGGKVLIIGGKP